MAVMGRTLWNKNLSFEEIVDDHYKAAFGKDWRKVKRYTQELSEVFDPPFLRKERSEAELGETLKKLAKIPALIHRFGPVIKSHLGSKSKCQARSWFYLREHAEICLAMAKAVEAMARQDRVACQQFAEQLIALVRRKEPRIHRVFDVRTFVWAWEDKDSHSPHSCRQV